MTTDVSEKNKAAGRSIAANPVALLLVTGFLVGLNFPLGKLAGAAEVSPTLWAALLSLGVCLLLGPILWLKKRLSFSGKQMVRYVVISAIISFIIPNLLLFTVIPHTGSGYAGLMFALSPVFTLTLAGIFRLKTPGFLGMLGIATGLAGAALVSFTRGGEENAPDLIWLIAALLVPMTLACGNIYRTIDWPAGAQPDALAFWSHGFSLLVYAVLLFAEFGSIPLASLAAIPLVALGQLIVGGLTFPVFFRLQQKGGPVLLSQLGYVAAAVSLVAATLLLGESYAMLTWIGAAVIAVGIGITVLAQIREN
ncbi:MAG: DMT family transporter [Sneathiellales bacterium]|nr:DMT family transporter [Sneathiellales bacterium]